MSQLNSLLESANSYKSLQSDAARLANKWSKTGLLEGMASETDKNNMSMILENQAKQLVTENTQTGGGTGTFNCRYRCCWSMGWCCFTISKKGIWTNRSERIRFGSTNEPSFRSSILLRLPIWWYAS